MAPALTATEPLLVLKRSATVRAIPEDEEELRSSSPSSQARRGDPSPAPSASEADTQAPEGNESGLDEMLLTAVQSTKDRLFVLKLDNQCENFLKDTSQTRLAFPHMNSYQRLIIHRLAVHFGLIHVADPARKGVVLFKSPESAIPTTRLCDIPLSECVAADQAPAPSIKIMQRHHHHHGGRGSRHSSTDSGSEGGVGGSKSIEEREAAYQAARARIFQEDAESDVSSTSGQSSGSRGTSKQSKATPRSQVARPRNPQGPPRQRAQQSAMYMGQGYPAGDYAGGFPLYPQMDPSATRGGHMAPVQMGPGGSRFTYPTPYEGTYVAPNQYYIPSPIPHPGAFPHPHPGPPAPPYSDWNGLPYPSQSGNPPPRLPRDHDGPSGYGYPPNLAAYAGNSSPYGLNPQAPAFTSQYPSLRSDGVALHYYPNLSNFNPPRPNTVQRPNVVKHTSPPEGSMGPSWASMCRDSSMSVDYGGRPDAGADSTNPYLASGTPGHLRPAAGRGRDQGREFDAARNNGHQKGAPQPSFGSQGHGQAPRVYLRPPDVAGRNYPQTPLQHPGVWLSDGMYSAGSEERPSTSDGGGLPKGAYGDLPPQSRNQTGYLERPASLHHPGSDVRDRAQSTGPDDELQLLNSLAELRVSHGDEIAEPAQRS
ncbi:hypothetical protein HDU86_001782 [Geranomyces michiganensis]|nr:hypothetical protein HDU86_001782 [Geranomyces michiganensis]